MRIERIKFEGFPPVGDAEILLKPNPVEPEVGAMASYRGGSTPSQLVVSAVRESGKVDLARDNCSAPVITHCELTDFLHQGEIAEGRALLTSGSSGRAAELHVFTGVNGTGKSRILGAIAAAAANDSYLCQRLGENETWKIGFYQFSQPRTLHEVWLRQETGRNTSISHPNPDFRFYGGLTFAYAGVPFLNGDALPASGTAKPATQKELASFSRGSDYSTRLVSLLLDLVNEANAELANRIGSGGNQQADKSRAEKTIEILQERLREELGLRSFAFRAVNRPQRDLSVDWNGKRLRFNQLPDGLRLVIGWFVDIVVMSDLVPAPGFHDTGALPFERPFILLLDEPETHLHVSWQRRILPLAQKLFPNAQMFVATHSPFVVSSVNMGWIHKLEQQEDGSVKILDAVKAGKGDSYMTAVQEVLGLKEWFDPETEQLLGKFDAALDAAYSENGASEKAMRDQAEALMGRSTEVRNLIAGLVAQFDRTKAAKARASQS